MSSKVSRMKSLDKRSIQTDKSKKSKTSKVSIQETDSQFEEVRDVPPHPLSTDCIILRGKGPEKLLTGEKNLIVPPSSPRGNFIVDRSIDSIPVKFNNVSDLNIPYIRILGIKKTIEILGEFFGCTIYKTNLIQFWFLDMVTDCLWKCQDEFMLDDTHQRFVLEWILYFFDMIRDPLRNFSRGEFFRIFREILTLAEDRIECGDAYFAMPEELCALNHHPDHQVDFDELLSDSTDSSLSFEDMSSNHSFLVIPSNEYPELPEFYELSMKECKCDISISSSVETLSEKSIYIEEEIQSQDDFQSNTEAEIIEPDISYSVSEFYQPDAKVHSRFLDELDEESEESILMDEVNDSSVEFEWVNDEIKPTMTAVEKPKSIATLSSHDTVHSGMRKIRSNSTKSKTKPERRSTQDDNASVQTLTFKKSKPKVSKLEKKLGECELLTAWFEYKLWEQRGKDMADPSKGWKAFEPKICSNDCICGQMEYTYEDFENEEYLQIKHEWLQYMKKYKITNDQAAHNVFINSCLLLIIKQFVFKYFFESFQYKLVKMACQIVPNHLYENLNRKWLFPKENREEFKRPVEKKPKPQKPVKEKPPKSKETKQKDKEKSSKGTGKTEKQPKIKPEKPHKPTKEEKDEMKRLQEEEEQRIRDQIAAEENRRFIFPLTLAANGEFFKSIFKDFVDLSDDKGNKGKDQKNKKKK